MNHTSETMETQVESISSKEDPDVGSRSHVHRSPTRPPADCEAASKRSLAVVLTIGVALALASTIPVWMCDYFPSHNGPSLLNVFFEPIWINVDAPSESSIGIRLVGLLAVPNRSVKGSPPPALFPSKTLKEASVLAPPAV